MIDNLMLNQELLSGAGTTGSISQVKHAEFLKELPSSNFLLNIDFKTLECLFKNT